jgi:hypothetical protein
MALTTDPPWQSCCATATNGTLTAAAMPWGRALATIGCSRPRYEPHAGPLPPPRSRARCAPNQPRLVHCRQPAGQRSCRETTFRGTKHSLPGSSSHLPAAHCSPAVALPDRLRRVRRRRADSVRGNTQGGRKGSAPLPCAGSGCVSEGVAYRAGQSGTKPSQARPGQARPGQARPGQCPIWDRMGLRG